MVNFRHPKAARHYGILLILSVFGMAVLLLIRIILDIFRS